MIDNDGMFYIEDGAEWVCLLSFWNFYKNMGALSLRPEGEEVPCNLPASLQSLRKAYAEAMGDGGSEAGELCCMLAAARVFEQSMRGYRPLRLLDAGGCPRPLVMLAEMAAVKAHGESGAFRCEVGANALKDGYFDMVLLGGDATEAHLRELMRVLRPGGELFCVAQEASVLIGLVEALPGEPAFKYRIDETVCVLTKTAAPSAREPAAAERMAGLKAGLNAVLSLDSSPEALSWAARTLTEMEGLAVELFDIDDIDLKQRVTEAKENVLTALYAPQGAFRLSCLEKARAFAGN
jgi:SAM-dependent methyltransferase